MYTQSSVCNSQPVTLSDRYRDTGRAQLSEVVMDGGKEGRKKNRGNEGGKNKSIKKNGKEESWGRVERTEVRKKENRMKSRDGNRGGREENRGKEENI